MMPSTGMAMLRQRPSGRIRPHRALPGAAEPRERGHANVVTAQGPDRGDERRSLASGLCFQIISGRTDAKAAPRNNCCISMLQANTCHPRETGIQPLGRRSGDVSREVDESDEKASLVTLWYSGCSRSRA